MTKVIHRIETDDEAAPAFMVVSTDPGAQQVTIHATHYHDNASNVPDALGRALLPVFAALVGRSVRLVRETTRVERDVLAVALPTD